MLKFAAYATVGAMFALGAAQAVVTLGQAGHPPELRRAETATAPIVPSTGPADGQAASVAKSSDGHYWANSVVPIIAQWARMFTCFGVPTGPFMSAVQPAKT